MSTGGFVRAFGGERDSIQSLREKVLILCRESQIHRFEALHCHRCENSGAKRLARGMFTREIGGLSGLGPALAGSFICADGGC